MPQRTSERGVQLISQFEGLRLHAYRCPAGIWTIGFGHTGPDVVPGLVITLERAIELLRADLRRFERAVTRLAGACDQEHFDALVSLVYNIGEANFAKSSVLRFHKAGDEDRAAHAFTLWNKARVKGRLTILPGLVRRRAAEASMYREGDFADVSKARPIAMVALTETQVAAGMESTLESAMKPVRPGSLPDMSRSGRVVRGVGTSVAAAGSAGASVIAANDTTGDVATDAMQKVEVALNQADAVGATVDPGTVAATLDRARETAEAHAAAGGVFDWKLVAVVLACLVIGFGLHAIWAAYQARTGER